MIKKTLFFFSICCFVLGSIFAQIPSGYYNNASGLSGTVLRDTLRNIITRGHVKLTYTPGVWNAYYTTDVKPAPSNTIIWDMYSDIPGGSNYTFTVGTNQCGNATGEGDCYSREHCLPKSWWGGTGITGSSDTQYTDLHHLFPSDQYVNGRKSNYPVAKVGTATYTSSNGSKLGNCNYTGGYTGIVFEPIDAYKGDFARAYFYLACRYHISSWRTGTPGTDAQYVISTTGDTYQQWYINMLLEWNANDPVSQKEIDRNNAIYNTTQHNRNPFIDHPEYVNYIWGAQTPTIKPQPDNHVSNMQVVAGNPDYSSITVNWTDATGTVIPDGYVVKISAIGFADIAAPVDGIPETNSTYVKIVNPSTGTVNFTGLSESTTYYVKIYPFTNTLTNTNYKTDGVVPQLSITTAAYSFTEGFETGLPTAYNPSGIQYPYTLFSGDWSTLNVMRNSTNEHGGLYCLQLKSDIGSNATTPALTTVGSLSFWCKAGTSGSNGLKIQKSTDGGSTFTDVQTLTITATLTQYTLNINEPAADVRIRFLNMAVQTLYIDDVLITNFVSQLNVGSITAFGTQMINTVSAEKSYTVSANNLANNNLVITPPAGFEISLTSGSGFVASPTTITLTPVAGTIAATTIYVRFKPTSVQVYSGIISHVCASATTQNVAVSGTATSSTVATVATNVSSTGFTANWNAVTGAESYYIDVYTNGNVVNATDLFISEYVEGSSSNKYIEIYNGTGSNVDLSNYKLRLYANGAVTPNNDVVLSGTLNNGSVIVYKNSSAAAYSGTATSNPAVNFNGDDAVALYKISTSSYVDIFGRIGEDPGTAWINSPNTTVDKTLVRKSSVTGGVTANPSSGFPTLATEWDQYNIDDVTHLGSHTFNGSPAQTFVAQNTNVNGTSFAVTGLTPNTTYFYRVRASGNSYTGDNSNIIATTIASGTHNWNELSGVVSTADVSVLNGSTLTLNTAASCENLNIISGGKLNINNGSALTVSGILTVEDGGTLIDNNTAASAITATVKRNITAATWSNGLDGWHLIASPNTSQAIAGNWASGNYDFYGYDEESNTWINQKDGANNMFSFTKGRGYLVAYETAVNKEFNGTLNNTDVTVSLTKTSGQGEGWNLLGNPFPSNLVWNDANWTLGNVEGLAKIWNEGSQSYSDISANGIIPANQGFFVRTTVSNVSLTIPSAARTHTAQAFSKSSQVPLLSLTVSNAVNTCRDIASIVINEQATTEYDLKFDGTKLYGSSIAPKLYSILSDGHELSTNAIPLPTNTTFINLGFKAGVNGNYTITADGIQTFTTCGAVILEDRKSNLTQNLHENPVYNFTAATSDNPDRFILHFATSLPNKNINIYAYENSIYINGSENIMQIAVYNLLGQQIKTISNVNGMQSIGMKGNASAYYIVKVITDHNVYTEKVWLK
ncbi:MAG: endonuclease [Bacteroidetes bacterium]|nr:endonuclease [Bacteroidota bacterium]